MDLPCDLQVDVNGEECFLINKDVISSYSGRIRKLFNKSRGATKHFKVIFHDFPGGAYCFELITRFCYNRGKISVSPSNTIVLYCVASFLEMNQSVSGTENLLELTEKSTKMISYWAWSELMIALKHCQDLLPVSSSSGIINKCLDCVIARIASSCELSPCPSSYSPDSSGFRLSFDSRSTESFKNSSLRATWWFEDFVVLEPPLIDMLVRRMINRTIDHGIISRFLVYYQKARFVVATTTDDKCHIMETVVALLSSLEQSATPCNKLFGILRISSNLRLSSDCKTKLESMIGSQLDQATLDNLLITSSVGSKSLYNVDLVLRFLKSFVGKEPNKLPLSRLAIVASMIDLYLAEVAPDPCLKPAKFLYLLRALPNFARDSYDGVYHAIDLYLKVHSGLSEDEKSSICSGLNFEKLSLEICEQLTHNNKFPSQSVKLALISQQSRLKSLLQDSNQSEGFLEPECSLLERETSRREASSGKQIVLYAGDLNGPSENERLKANLQGMQCRVMELEKICQSMQIQMTKVMKARLSSHKKAKSLPKLCS